MTKCPVSLSGGDSAESVVMTSLSATRLRELHCHFSTTKDSVTNETYLLLDGFARAWKGADFIRKLADEHNETKLQCLLAPSVCVCMCLWSDTQTGSSGQSDKIVM